MANEVVNSIFYQVKPQSPVHLTITVGNGQVGGSSVTFKDAKIGGNGVSAFRIPPDKDPDQELKDKKAECTTTVQRKNTSTGHCSVTYVLGGGVKVETYTFETTLPKMGDLADFSTTIFFE